MSRGRSVGFGTRPGIEGVVVSPDVLRESQQPEQASAEYLREIRDRYVLSAGIASRTFSLAANIATKFDESQTVYNAVMVTVTAGVALIYLGDFSGLSGSTGNIPHVVVSAAASPVTQTIPLPPGRYIFTVQADSSGTCTGCFLPMAL